MGDCGSEFCFQGDLAAHTEKVIRDERVHGPCSMRPCRLCTLVQMAALPAGALPCSWRCMAGRTGALSPTTYSLIASLSLSRSLASQVKHELEMLAWPGKDWVQPRQAKGGDAQAAYDVSPPTRDGPHAEMPACCGHSIPLACSPRLFEAVLK